MLAGGRMLDDAAQIDVPTAVFIGSKDTITPPSARRVFEALRPSAREAFEEFAGAGHAICQEQPAAVARAITAIVGHKAAAYA